MLPVQPLFSGPYSIHNMVNITVVNASHVFFQLAEQVVPSVTPPVFLIMIFSLHYYLVCDNTTFISCLMTFRASDVSYILY